MTNRMLCLQIKKKKRLMARDLERYSMGKENGYVILGRENW